MFHRVLHNNLLLYHLLLPLGFYAADIFMGMLRVKIKDATSTAADSIIILVSRRACVM